MHLLANKILLPNYLKTVIMWIASQNVWFGSLKRLWSFTALLSDGVKMYSTNFYSTLKLVAFPKVEWQICKSCKIEWWVAKLLFSKTAQECGRWQIWMYSFNIHVICMLWVGVFKLIKPVNSLSLGSAFEIIGGRPTANLTQATCSLQPSVQLTFVHVQVSGNYRIFPDRI